MRTLRSWVTIAALVVAAGPSIAIAQQLGGPANPRREALERQLRMRTGEIVRRRLELSDDQMTRLQAANRQFEQQRVAMFTREREVRGELRREIMAGDKANQDRVSQLIDQTLLIERRRFDLVQDEQKELAKFLTPVQRAKLMGLQNELRRRTQQMRTQQMRTQQMRR